MAVYPTLQIKNKKFTRPHFQYIDKNESQKYDCQIAEAEPPSGYFKTMNLLICRAWVDMFTHESQNFSRVYHFK